MDNGNSDIGGGMPGTVNPPAATTPEPVRDEATTLKLPEQQFSDQFGLGTTTFPTTDASANTAMPAPQPEQSPEDKFKRTVSDAVDELLKDLAKNKATV